LTASRKILHARVDALGQRFSDVPGVHHHFDSDLQLVWKPPFTLGFAFSLTALYLVELFMPGVRTTAASFVFNGAFDRLGLSGYRRLNCRIDGWSRPALIMSSVYVYRIDRSIFHAGDCGQVFARVTRSQRSVRPSFEFDDQIH
jgi:hypothetical protein